MNQGTRIALVFLPLAFCGHAAAACELPNAWEQMKDDRRWEAVLAKSYPVEATFVLPEGYPETYGEIEATLLNERNGKTLPLIVDTREMLNGCSRVYFPQHGQRGTFHIQRKNGRFEFVQFTRHDGAM